MHNHEHMIVLAKGRQVPRPNAARLESVGKRHVLEPTARLRVDDPEDNGIRRDAVDVRRHNERTVAGVGIHFIPAAHLSDARSDLRATEIDDQGEAAAGNHYMVVVTKSFTGAVALELAPGQSSP